MEEYRILIVEDIKAAHHLYEQALKTDNEAYIIKCVDRGAEALKELKLHNYQLVMLDIHLPDMRGEEVLETMRKRGSNVPVLILTAFAQKSVVLNVTGFGIHDYLIKPVDLNVLRKRVSEILVGNKEIVHQDKSKIPAKTEKVATEKKENKLEYDPKYVWKKKLVCPICANNFESFNYKNKSQALKEKETDFHEVYDVVDPIIYDVLVCPSCLFAATVSDFAKISAKDMERLFDDKRKSNFNFNKNRNIDMALESYELAIHCKNITEKPNEALLANLYLKKSWLYRNAKENKLEIQNMEEALKLYEKKYLTAETISGSLSENGLAYLIAELARRIGDYGKATKYFSIIVNSLEAKKEKYIYNLAKKQYELLKEENR